MKKSVIETTKDSSTSSGKSIFGEMEKLELSGKKFIKGNEEYSVTTPEINTKEIMKKEAERFKKQLREAKSLKEFLLIYTDRPWPISGGWGRKLSDPIVLEFDDGKVTPDFEMYIISQVLQYEGYNQWNKTGQSLKNQNGKDIDEITVETTKKIPEIKNGEWVLNGKIDDPIIEVFYFDVSQGLKNLVK